MPKRASSPSPSNRRSKLLSTKDVMRSRTEGGASLGRDEETDEGRGALWSSSSSLSSLFSPLRPRAAAPQRSDPLNAAPPYVLGGGQREPPGKTARCRNNHCSA